MKITTVSLSRTIPTGAYMNDKITMEASLHPGESHETVLDNLSHLINDWHKKANPHLYDNGVNGSDLPAHLKTEITFGPPPTIQTERADPNDTLALIQNAPSLEILTTFKLLASKDKDLYAAYNLRLKQLV